MSRSGPSGLTVTPRSDREIVVSRVFDAPRQLVFDAWTKPELLARWFGPHGWTVPTCEIDIRPGGHYRLVMRGPDGPEISMRGTCREIVQPERLVTTASFEGFAEVGLRPEDETLTTATFAEQDGRTTWTAVIRYPSKEVRDAALDLSPAWTGMSATLDRLADLLRTLPA